MRQTTYTVYLEDGLIEIECQLGYYINKGCRATWECPGEPTFVEDVHVIKIDSVRFETPGKPHICKQLDPTLAVAFAGVAKVWIDNNSDKVADELLTEASERDQAEYEYAMDLKYEDARERRIGGAV